MPRTATTFLQRNIFPFITDFQLVSLPYSHFGAPFQKLQYQDDSLYSFEEVKNKLTELYQREKVLISNENFTGQSLFWYNGNRSRNAQRLKALFPEATIILTLRNQPDLLRSMYEINLQWKETKSLDDFIITNEENFSLHDYFAQKSPNLHHTRYPVTDSYEHIEGYDYLPLIKLYQSLFPKVCVLFYEDFVMNKEKFITNLEHALDTPFSEKVKKLFFEQPKINSGLDASQAEKLRKLNRLATFAQHNKFIAAYYYRRKRAIINKTSSGKKIDFSKEKKLYLTEYFAQKNKQLQQELNIIPEHLKDKYFL
tara:strand:- start:59496 stop:60428 length:933 start_codon:yes stop_codon:yes gene_type:complete